MKKSLIALAFGTLGLGIAEFVMMGILGHQHSRGGTFHLGIRTGSLCWGTGLGFGTKTSVEAHPAGIGDTDYGRKYMCGIGS